MLELTWFNIWTFICNGIITTVTLMLLADPIYRKFKFKLEQGIVADFVAKGIISKVIVNKIKIRRKKDGDVGKVQDKNGNDPGK